jgi:hypothetical protein
MWRLCKALRPAAGFHVDKPPNHLRCTPPNFSRSCVTTTESWTKWGASCVVRTLSRLSSALADFSKCVMWMMVFLILVEPNYYWFKSVEASDCHILMYCYLGTGVPIWTILMTTRRGAATEHWTDEGWTKVGKVETKFGYLSLEQPIGKANCVALQIQWKKSISYKLQYMALSAPPPTPHPENSFTDQGTCSFIRRSQRQQNIFPPCLVMEDVQFQRIVHEHRRFFYEQSCLSIRRYIVYRVFCFSMKTVIQRS